MDGTAALVTPSGGLAERQPWTPGLFEDMPPETALRRRRAGGQPPGSGSTSASNSNGAVGAAPLPRPLPLRRGRWPQASPGNLAELLAPPPVQPSRCQSVLRAHDGRDLPGALSVNPYLGCALACQLCPAALALQPVDGTANAAPDPSTANAAVLAKVNIAERLREELRRPGYRARPLALGSAAELYQDAERDLGLTRAVLQLLLETGHPVTLRSRSPALLRDLDLLGALAEQNLLAVSISLCSLDTTVWPRFEGRCAAPSQRLQAMGRLARAGVPVGLWLGPLLPADQDPQREALFEAVQAAGARFVHWAPDIGQEDDLAALAQRFGLDRRWPELDTTLFRPPAALRLNESAKPRQVTLF